MGAGKKKETRALTKEKAKEPKVREPKVKNKKGIVIAVIILLVIAIAAAVYFFVLKDKNKVSSVEGVNFPSSNAGSSYSGDSVSAYGVINIGTTEETLEIDNMTSSLKIAQVLFSSGDTIEAGTPILTFTEDSVNTVKAELEKNLREAELAYRSGAIEYQESLISAKYTYEAALLKGEQADEIYDETVANLKSSLSSATETYNNAKSQLSEYKEASKNNTYYTDYKVEEYIDLYNECFDVLNKKMEEWGVSWNDVTQNQRLGADTLSQYKYVLNQLYQVIQSVQRDYENALSNYETASADLSYNLVTLQLSMSTLEETYLNAKKSYETGLLTAEKTKQTSKTQASLAESEYEANVEKAETDYETLLSKYEDAQSDYETFMNCIVDNQYIATTGGTVSRTNVRNNSSLSAGGRILTYSDFDDATVSVSVDQSYISKLSVGDAAICYASSTGILNGTIISISPVTQSSSISSVSYSVTVRLDNSNANLSSNTTVTVLFGSDAEAAAGALSTSGDSGNGMDGFDMNEFSSGDTSENSSFGGMDSGNMPNMGGGGFPGMGN